MAKSARSKSARLVVAGASQQRRVEAIVFCLLLPAMRLAVGNFGDCKTLREGVSELRVDWGPGYRVYFAMSGRACILLLCGGDKRKQTADINRAVIYWRDYKQRTEKT